MKVCAHIQATVYLLLSLTGGLAQTTCGDFCTQGFWETSTPTAIAQAIRDVDVESVGDYGITPLHMVAGRGSIEDLRYLISSGANVNARSDNGWTPVHIAARIGSLPKVRELLSEGADITARDQHGYTVLHFAVSSNNTDLVAFFMSQGVHVDSRNASGETPLRLAVIEGSLEVVELLMRSGADVNTQDNRGMTPLHTVALLDRSDVVALLLTYGAEVGSTPREGHYAGETPLHSARSAHVVQLLVAAGADVDAPDSRGNTPLHHAALHANPETVMALLGFGADGTIVNEFGYTPFDRASSNDEIMGTDAYWALSDARFR